jgi:predicted HicB family RNase H-like nuclease
MSETLFLCNGYTATGGYSPEDGCWAGEISGTEDTILFSGSTWEEAFANFKDLIDHYPEDCAKLGDKPNPPPIETIDSPWQP